MCGVELSKEMLEHSKIICVDLTGEYLLSS